MTQNDLKLSPKPLVILILCFGKHKYWLCDRYLCHMLSADPLGAVKVDVT